VTRAFRLALPTCRWFAACTKVAPHQVEHPTLGWVNICTDHLAWLSDAPGGGPKWVPPLVAARCDGLPEGHPYRVIAGLDAETARADS